MIEEVNVRILFVQLIDIVRVGEILHAGIEIFGTETFTRPETCAQDHVGIATEGKGIASDPIGQCRGN